MPRPRRGGGPGATAAATPHPDRERSGGEGHGREVPLLKKEFDILAYFLQRPGHLVDKSVLAEAVCGDHADQADNFHFVYAQMKNLRHNLSEAGANIEIKAVYGFGYKLIENSPS